MQLLENVVEYTTSLADSDGQPVVLHITQPTGFDQLSIKRQAEEQYPMFDTTPFEQEMETAAVPGATYIDKDHPEYKRLMVEIMRNRNEWFLLKLLTAFVDVAPPHTQDGVISALKARLQRKSQYIRMSDDPWGAALQHALLTDREMSQVLDILNSKSPLEEVEIRGGMRMFRLAIQG